MHRPRTSALIIFIKNPEKGKVKTRLAKQAGDDKALQIYKSLLAFTRKISIAVPAHRYLFYSTFIDTSDEWEVAFFDKHLQEGDDLGQKMHKAFLLALSQHAKAVIIGSDCATLSPLIINKALAALDHYDYVVGPATDGGYYLLGMNTPSNFLFSNMEWSTETVLSTTLRRITGAGKNYFLLPELSDIDHLEDWEQHGWTIRDMP